MSLAFNDETTLKGIVQTYELEIGAELGFVSGNPVRLKQLTASVNSALDDFIALALRSSGTWQFDDSGHTDYPTIEADLVANQRDYTFTTDEQGNLILDIFKVLVKTPAGIYVEVQPIDQQTRGEGAGIWDGQNMAGTPTAYDKTANGIIFNLLPNYSWRLANEGAKGVKVLINREGSYFTHTDTSKKPGVPGLFHRYFAIRPAEDHARRHSLSNYEALRVERLELEASIAEYFGARNRDEMKRLAPALQDNE